MWIILAILLLLCTFYWRKNRECLNREGLDQDPHYLARQSIQAAQKDPRMTPSQQQALEDALSYLDDIQKV